MRDYNYGERKDFSGEILQFPNLIEETEEIIKEIEFKEMVKAMGPLFDYMDSMVVEPIPEKIEQVHRIALKLETLCKNERIEHEIEITPRVMGTTTEIKLILPAYFGVPPIRFKDFQDIISEVSCMDVYVQNDEETIAMCFSVLDTYKIVK